MASAVKNDPEVRTSFPGLGLAGTSLAGALFVVLGVIAVCHVLPWVWQTQVAPVLGVAVFYQRVLLVSLLTAGAIALLLAAPRAIKWVPGSKAGATVIVLGLVATGLVTLLLGWLLDALGWMDSLGSWAGSVLGVTAEVGSPEANWDKAVAGGILGIFLLVGFCLYVLPRFQRAKVQARLIALEEDGWFDGRTYKRGQGLRARRGTMLGLLLLFGSGIWVYALHRAYTIGTAMEWLGSQNVPGIRYWALPLPFASGVYLMALPWPAFLIPTFFALAVLWLTYRVVNYPKFADFLIATEAEMNKVSWSTWKRLREDTVVVLVTVTLFASFLLAMDSFWSFLLSQLGVLQIGQH